MDINFQNTYQLLVDTFFNHLGETGCGITMGCENEELDISRLKKKLLSISIVTVMLLASFSMLFVGTVEAAPQSNVISVAPSLYNVTVGDTFYTFLTTIVNWQINNITVTNITFKPVGILNYTNTIMGDLFSGGSWWTPDDNGTINNASGYAYNLTWINSTSVNLTGGNLTNITWYACGVGTAYINLTGTTRNDSGVNFTTTFNNGTIIVHPQCPSGFNATTLTSTSIRLNFTKGFGADYTIIRRAEGWTPPMNITDGDQVYNGTGIICVDSNCTPDTSYSYAAWGWNATENMYSLFPAGTGEYAYRGGQGWFLQEHYSDVTDRYIENNTEKTFNFSFIINEDGPTQSLHNLTIILPTNFTYAGNNGTTVSDPADFTVYNTSNMIVWNATDYADGFLCDGTKYFWFNATAIGGLGSYDFQIIAYSSHSEFQSFNMSVFITKNFSFDGSIVNNIGDPIEGATATMTVYSFSQNGPPITVGSFTADTNSTGYFNVTGIPTTLENISDIYQGGGMDMFYSLSAAEYEPTDTYAINISKSLPSLPIAELLTMLDNPEIYLQPAISFRVNVTGPNYDWSTYPPTLENYTSKNFQIMAKDLKLGYSVKELFTGSQEKIFSIPAGRNYSFSIYPSQSFPVSVRFCNITSTLEGSGDFNLSGVTVQNWSYNGTYLLNVSVNVSYEHKWLNGSFTGIDGIEEMRVVAYIMEDQDMICENWALPFNLGNESGAADDSYDISNGTYNITLPATNASSYLMLRAYAKNASGYYLGSHITTALGCTLSESTYSFTMHPLIDGQAKSISSNNVSSQWNSTVIVNTTAVLFRLVDSNGTLLSNENAFIDVERELESTYYKYMVNAEEGVFNVSLIEGESLKKLTIYSQQYAPVSTYVSADVISGATSTDTINCSNGICNITMRSFGDYDPLGENKNFSMRMYTSNSTCDVPNPPAICDLCGDQNESVFSPFNAILKGDVSLMISNGNISVYYLNVDLLASGPPDACFDNGTESGSGIDAAWQFGSQGPDIYDSVLIKIPYNNTMHNRTINVSIPVLYDNEFNVIWNISVNTTSDISTDPRLSGYTDYLNTPYEAYLNGTGIFCNESDTTLSSGLGYKDKNNRTIWIKIPHFSGVGPLVGGIPPEKPSSFSASASSTSQIDLSWNKGAGADYTRIQRKTGSYPTSISDGTNIYNDTGTSKSDTSLSSGIKYYYSAWSWNATEGLWSEEQDPAQKSATTSSDSSPPGDDPDEDEPTPTTDDPPSITDVSHDPTDVTSEDVVTISATVTDDNTISSVRLYWNDGSEHSKSMTLESDSIYSAEIGPFTELITVTYWINATDNASQSTDSSTSSFTVSDISGPTITIINPASGAIIYDTTPTIKASYSDPSGINTSSVTLTLDVTDVAATTVTSSSVTYTPTTALDYGNHTVELEVSDSLGNVNTKEWSFSIEETASISEEELGNITSGDETEIIPENTEETGIDSISFTAIANLTNVKISVAKLKDKPGDLNELPTDVISYLYLNLELTGNDIDLTSEDMESIKIKFKVEKSWLEDNKIEKSSIKLLRYVNGWEILTTTLDSEDSNYVYYEATTPGFSTFAIVGTPTTEDAPFPALYISIIVAIIAVIAIIFILFKMGYLYIEKNDTD